MASTTVDSLVGRANPITDWLGDQATSPIANGFNQAMRDLWQWATSLLRTAFTITDTLTQPHLDPTTGPLKTVMTTTVYLAAGVAVVMVFAQIGMGALRGGRGLGRVLIGTGQYLLISGMGVGVWDLLVQASNQVGATLLHQGLHVSSWSAIGNNRTLFAESSNAASSVGLGVAAVVCLIPAAIGMLVEDLVREGAILVLAATIPILAAGLVSDATADWFWRGLRWMLVLAFAEPLVALVMTIGVGIATAISQSRAADAMGAAHDTLGAIVSGLIMLMALACPLALGKLMGFVNPSSLSGASLRGWFAGDSGGGSGSGGGTGAAEDTTVSRFADGASGMASEASDGFGTVAASEQGAGQAAGPLDALGVGNPGGPVVSPHGGSGGGNGGSDPQDGGEPPEDGGGSEAGAGGESAEVAEVAEVAPIAAV